MFFGFFYFCCFFFFTWKLENKLFKNDSRISRNVKIAQRRRTRLQWLMGPLNSTHRKGFQSKVFVVLSKGSRCYFWGLLDCDDRRSPWWASRVGPQHDTVMISVSFNSYVNLAIFFIIPALFCFVLEHETIYTTRVVAVFDFYYRT